MSVTYTPQAVDGLAAETAKQVERTISVMSADNPGIHIALEDRGRFLHLMTEATHKVFCRMLSGKFGYLMGSKPKSLVAQNEFLAIRFSNFNMPVTAPNRSLPEGAYGWFLVPDWRLCAKNYPDAVQDVLSMIKTWRHADFTDEVDDLFAGSTLSQTKRTEEYWSRLRAQQPDDGGYVVAAQLGPKHQNISARQMCANYQALHKHESGLDLFTAAVIVLGHLEHFNVPRNLVIACPGDQWRKPEDNATDSYVPALVFTEGRMKLGRCPVGNKLPDGSGSLFD